MKLTQITLWLGRHETRGSGLWVYIENILTRLVSELNEKGVTVTVVGAGTSELKTATEELLSDTPAEGKLLWLEDPFGWRHFGNIRDLFVIPDGSTTSKEETLFHGLSNTLPLLGRNQQHLITIHDLLQAFPVIPPGSLFLKLRTAYYRAYLSFILKKRSQWIITGHEKTRVELEEEYSLGARTTVFYPPLSPTYCEPISEEVLSRASRDYFLTFVSTDPRKNFKSVLKVFEEYEGDEELRIVLGTPTLSSVLRHRINQGKKSDKISIEVAPDREELRLLFQGAVGTLFPSLGEGFGYPVYESVSQGTPALTSKDLLISSFTEARELVVGCDPTSLESIRDGLLELKSRNLTPDARLKASQEVQRALHPEKCVEQLIQCYFSVANS